MYAYNLLVCVMLLCTVEYKCVCIYIHTHDTAGVYAPRFRLTRGDRTCVTVDS